MIYFLIAAVVWLAIVALLVIAENGRHIGQLSAALAVETQARREAEREAAAHLRTIEFLQHELDVRNGWNETGDLLSPVTSPMALTLLEEYQPHVIEWLPFSLN